LSMSYHAFIHNENVCDCLTDSEVIVTEGVEKADGVAVDWIARNLYWTDAGRNYIAVSRLNGTMKKIIIETEIDEPRYCF